VSTTPADSRYRALSFWHDSVPDDLTPRAPLAGDIRADVAIIGGGLTGLWAAYYLTERDPSLSIVVLEKEIAGFGASGRNGGWCSALFPASGSALERHHGFELAVRMRRAMVDTVDEVGRVAEAEGIDCDFRRGGTVSFVRSDAQRDSARAEVAEAERFGADDVRFVDRSANGSSTAVFDAACARVHPAKLVRGLARAVERRGVRILEQTEVLGWRSGEVRTARGTVSAGTVIVALEGYTATIPQSRRRMLPLYSLMIATEPIPERVWDAIGIAHGETFTDYRHLLVYGQRTADDRFAFGGRGARYHWGSAIRNSYDRDPRVFAHLKRALDDFFPQARPYRVTHSWGGALGVPRDWHAGVRLEDGVATAGGYVGDGLATTNLAGRTLADLITGTHSELTTLPWVGHRSPDWEPEPLRFAGANLGVIGTTVADAEERMTRRPSLAAKLLAPLTGH
jgi:glycine/D-amino acid oxidase-like deaminating enzyme